MRARVLSVLFDVLAERLRAVAKVALVRVIEQMQLAAPRRRNALAIPPLGGQRHALGVVRARIAGAVGVAAFLFVRACMRSKEGRVGWGQHARRTGE